MSNKTTFKRIALAVVAAMGFGILSSAPSLATVTSLTVTPVDGSATTLVSDSSTAGSITVAFTKTAATDSVTVSAFALSKPTLGTLPSNSMIRMMLRDTTSSTTPAGSVAQYTSAVAKTFGAAGLNGTVFEGDTVVTLGAGDDLALDDATQGRVSARYLVWIDTDSTTGAADLELKAGTYTFQFIVTPYDAGVAGTPVTSNVSIVVSAVASESLTIDPTKSIAVLSNAAVASGGGLTVNTVDSVLSVSAEATGSAVGYVNVRTYNSSDIERGESITATISGAGAICNTGGSVCGSSLVLVSDGNEQLQIKANGVAGVATINISTPTKTWPAKTMTFFAENPATVTASARIPVVGITAASGANAITVTAKDANQNVWGGQAYLFSTDTSIADATAAACSFQASLGVHYCSVTGLKAGQSKFQIGNKSTLATSTVKGDVFDGPRVTLKSAATVKIEFNKAAYAPGEKAVVYVTPLDDTGFGVVGGTLTSMFAAGGITSSVAFSSGSDTLTATDLTVATTTSSTTGAKAGSAMYTVYMPFGKGTVTLSATGGAGLPASGRVAVTASADVVDDSVDAAVDAAQEATDAAIAATDAAILAQEAADEAASAAIAAQETAQAAVDAVTALSAEVTKLVAQLATLQKLLNRVAKRVGVKR